MDNTVDSAISNPNLPANHQDAGSEREVIDTEEITAIKSASPIVKKVELPVRDSVELSFYEAVKQIVLGKRVTRKAWESGDFCFLRQEFLCINTGGVDHTWIVSLGDIAGVDWIVID